MVNAQTHLRVILGGKIYRFCGGRVVKPEELTAYRKPTAAPGALPHALISQWEIKKQTWGPFGFYYDAEIAFVLRFDGITVACASCMRNQENSAVCVCQIQGKKGMAEKLALLRWEKFLINYAAQWAKKNGWKEIWIQPANKNGYYNNNREESLRMRYDVTARRLGFRYRSIGRDNGYWVKAL